MSFSPELSRDGGDKVRNFATICVKEGIVSSRWGVLVIRKIEEQTTYRSLTFAIICKGLSLLLGFSVG